VVVVYANYPQVIFLEARNGPIERGQLGFSWSLWSATGGQLGFSWSLWSATDYNLTIGVSVSMHIVRL